jgi:hypothetical protein
LWELFNWGTKLVYKDFVPVLVELSVANRKPEIIYERINAFKMNAEKFGAVSAKYHTFHYDPELIELFQNPEIQVVSITRKNIPDTIWSYCIAVQTKEWFGKIKTETLYIKRSTFDSVLESLRNARRNLLEIKKFVHTIDIAYEDALYFEKSRWWKKNSARVRVQNAKTHINITNHDEVQSWIDCLDIENFYHG